MCKVSIIVAVSKNNVIGKDNQLIWHLPADLKHFKKLTTGHHIIMGRKTFESIGKALPNRVSVIITRQKNYKQENCIITHSLKEAINKAKEDTEIFIIGGASIYEEAIKLSDKIYLTSIDDNFEGDTFFPTINWSEWEKIEEQKFEADKKNKYNYSFITFENKYRKI